MQNRFFCPNCHREISNNIVGLNQAKITGKINFLCGWCKKGKIVIKSNQKTEEIEIMKSSEGEKAIIEDANGIKNT